MAQFFNSRDDIVSEAIDGLISSSGGALTRLDGYPFIRVVLCAAWDKSRVAVISGGGAGHEPAHAGFVGRGMLTAAVCGDVFASPSVDAVLAGILAVTGKAGCLLIVKNYTGDRLNFGLAAERARAFGLKVNMVIVQDDIAIPDISRPRGVAGSILAHKLAGAVSESGGDLAAVTLAATRAASGAMSFGMALDSCTVPGSQKEVRIPTGEVELGLGIHGEPGVQRVRFMNAHHATAMVADVFAPRLHSGRYLALLNNLSGTTDLEMSILAKELQKSVIGGAISHIIGPAPMMTALDMHGFSLTLYPLSDDDLALLDQETSAQAWPGIKAFRTPTLLPLPTDLRPILAPPSASAKNASLLISACRAMIDAETDLNALDAKSGDGDTGSTLATAARALMARVADLPLADLPQLFRTVGQDLSQTMGGSSGVLLAILCTATGEALARGLDMSAGLAAGLSRMQEIGGAKPGDRTMIDAFLPAVISLPGGLKKAAVSARAGANLTATMTKAHAGRASYVGADHLRGYVDPGAEAVARLFEALTRLQKD